MAVVAVRAAQVFAADAPIGGTPSGGLLSRVKQTLGGSANSPAANVPVSGDGKLPLHAAIGGSQPGQPTKTEKTASTHWWQFRSKPVGRTALDFWSQDSTIH